MLIPWEIVEEDPQAAKSLKRGNWVNGNAWNNAFE